MENRSAPGAKSTGLVLLLAGLVLGAGAQADVTLPLSSLRAQPDSNCWAYGAAHMTEARLELRDRVSVAIDVEKSYRFWQLHDRLVQAAATKTASDDLLEVEGFAADYWDIMASHGFETFHVEPAPTPPSFVYPNAVGFLLTAPTYDDAFEDDDALAALQQTLITSSQSASDAEAAIMAGLNVAFHTSNPTAAVTPWPWAKGTAPTAQIFEKMVGPDLEKSGDTYSRYAFVLLDSYYLAGEPQLDGKWLRYNDNRDWAIGMADHQKMLAIDRLSLDRGWPATFESADHVMTVLGYKALPAGSADPFAYEISDSAGYDFPAGVTWQTESAVLKVIVDSTVFYPTLKDQLISPSSSGPLTATLGVPIAPSIRLPARR